MIVLKVYAAGRVLSAARYAKAPKGALIMDGARLPEGDLSEYWYVDGAFIYDPAAGGQESQAPTLAERMEAIEKRLAGFEALLRSLAHGQTATQTDE